MELTYIIVFGILYLKKLVFDEAKKGKVSQKNSKPKNIGVCFQFLNISAKSSLYKIYIFYMSNVIQNICLLKLPFFVYKLCQCDSVTVRHRQTGDRIKNKSDQSEKCFPSYFL